MSATTQQMVYATMAGREALNIVIVNLGRIA